MPGVGEGLDLIRAQLNQRKRFIMQACNKAAIEQYHDVVDLALQRMDAREAFDAIVDDAIELLDYLQGTGEGAMAAEFVVRQQSVLAGIGVETGAADSSLWCDLIRKSCVILLATGTNGDVAAFLESLPAMSLDPTTSLRVAQLRIRQNQSLGNYHTAMEEAERIVFNAYPGAAWEKPLVWHCRYAQALVLQHDFDFPVSSNDVNDHLVALSETLAYAVPPWEVGLRDRFVKACLSVLTESLGKISETSQALLLMLFGTLTVPDSNRPDPGFNYIFTVCRKLCGQRMDEFVLKAQTYYLIHSYPQRKAGDTVQRLEEISHYFMSKSDLNWARSIRNYIDIIQLLKDMERGSANTNPGEIFHQGWQSGISVLALFYSGVQNAWRYYCGTGELSASEWELLCSERMMKHFPLPPYFVALLGYILVKKSGVSSVPLEKRWLSEYRRVLRRYTIKSRCPERTFRRYLLLALWDKLKGRDTRADKRWAMGNKYLSFSGSAIERAIFCALNPEDTNHQMIDWGSANFNPDPRQPGGDSPLKTVIQHARLAVEEAQRDAPAALEEVRKLLEKAEALIARTEPGMAGYTAQAVAEKSPSIIDLKHTTQVLGWPHVMAIKQVRRYVRQSEEWILMLTDAGLDEAVLKKTVHKIKGVSKSLGMQRVAELCESMEDMGITPYDSRNLLKLLERARSEAIGILDREPHADSAEVLV